MCMWHGGRVPATQRGIRHPLPPPERLIYEVVVLRRSANCQRVWGQNVKRPKKATPRFQENGCKSPSRSRGMDPGSLRCSPFLCSPEASRIRPFPISPATCALHQNNPKMLNPEPATSSHVPGRHRVWVQPPSPRIWGRIRPRGGFCYFNFSCLHAQK